MNGSLHIVSLTRVSSGETASHRRIEIGRRVVIYIGVPIHPRNECTPHKHIAHTHCPHALTTRHIPSTRVCSNAHQVIPLLGHPCLGVSLPQVIPLSEHPSLG